MGLSVCCVGIDFVRVEEEVSTHRGTGTLLLLVSLVLRRRTCTMTVTFDLRSQSADAGLRKEMVGGVRDRQEDDRNAAGLRELIVKMRQKRSWHWRLSSSGTMMVWMMITSTPPTTRNSSSLRSSDRDRVS